MVHLPGLIVAPLTPFDADLNIDQAKLAQVIENAVPDSAMIIAAGVEAQEYQYLDVAARKDLISRSLDLVAGRVPVAAGISNPNFRTAVELAHHAQKAGAHAIQLLAPLRPFGGVPTQEDLLAYYEAVSAETDLPIMAYLNAGPGADPTPAATLAIAKLPKVHYVKESSRDMTRVGRLIAEIELAGHARYFTTMQLLLPTLLLGGSGVTLPTPASRLAKKLVDAFVAGDIVEAARLQQQFSLWPAKWMGHGLTAVMKATLDIIGQPIGGLYPPFKSITGADLEALRDYVQSTDLMKG